MYFFNYFMNLNKAPIETIQDKWYTTNFKNIDSVLGMSPINSYSPLETTIQSTNRFGQKNKKESLNNSINLTSQEAYKIQKEIKQQIEQIAKGPKMKKYFNSYNDFTGEYDPYLFNINTLTKAIRKDKSTNLFTIDKSKLPGSIRQTYETISGDMVNNLALIENVIEDINSTQITDNIIDENAMDMEKHK